MSYLVACEGDGCCNAARVTLDEAGRPVIPSEWHASSDQSTHVCPDCFKAFSKELEEALLDAGGVKLPNGMIDMKGAKKP